MQKTRDYNEAFLVNTSDPVELEYITDMLSEMDISFRAEEEGKEQYISLIEGKSFGISIYVDETRLEEAQKLLTPLNAEQQEHEEIAEVQEEELISEQVCEATQKATRVFKKAFLYPLFIILGLAVLKFLDSSGFREYVAYIIRLLFTR